VPDYRFMMAVLDELDLKWQLKMLHLLTSGHIALGSYSMSLST